MSPPPDCAKRLRVVVCGTTFGQVYLRALPSLSKHFELVGVLAQGSARSRACAERLGVPLFIDPESLPKDTDLACVVVRGGTLGGRGTDLAKALMARGIHVLQEHPVHHDELTECLAHSRRHGVIYRVNTFYPWLAPVREFVSTAKRLLACRSPLFVDAASAIHVTYPLFDILGQIFGGVRPWSLQALPKPEEGGAAFRSLEGRIADIPFTLRVQNQIDPSDPDNHLHVLHRITIGTDGGNLTLVDTHGPMVFHPRLYVPPTMKDTFDLDASTAAHLDFPSASLLDADESPTFRQIFGSVWPGGVANALVDMRKAIECREDPRRLGQYHLALCRIWQETTSKLGYPEVVQRPAPEPLSPAYLASIRAPNPTTSPS